jgi:type III secretion system low calcium response chaperone LcrH/SycD
MEEKRIPRSAFEKIKDPQVLAKQIAEGKTLQEVIGYSDKQMAEFYTIAHTLFERQEYSQAQESFRFLTSLNPYVLNYWLGQGMCEHLLGEYEKALISYAMAILVDPKHPLAHYHSASCYQVLKDETSAKACLKMIIASAKDSDDELFVKIYKSAGLKLNKMKKT